MRNIIITVVVAMSTSTSPKTSLAKLVLYPKAKPFKIMVLGQSGVGKSGKTTLLTVLNMSSNFIFIYLIIKLARLHTEVFENFALLRLY